MYIFVKFNCFLVEVEDGMIYIIINPGGDSTVPNMSKELKQVLSEENDFKPPNIYSYYSIEKPMFFIRYCL